MLAAARLQRHSVVLDLVLGSGLVTFELLRRCPEDGVFAVAAAGAAPGVQAQLAALPAPLQPTLVPDPAAVDAADLISAYRYAIHHAG